MVETRVQIENHSHCTEMHSYCLARYQSSSGPIVRSEKFERIRFQELEVLSIRLKSRRVIDEETNDERFMWDWGAIDQAFANSKSIKKGPAQHLVFDLSDVSYLEHDALVFLGALVRERQALGAATYFRLPTRPRVVKFLRAWNWPGFIAAIQGSDFINWVTDDQVDEVAAWSDLPDAYVSVEEVPGLGRAIMIHRRHLAIVQIAALGEPNRASMLARDNYLEEQFVAILDRVLAREGRRIGGIVVEEAVRNASSHANARIAFTSFQFVESSEKYGREVSSVSLVVWDDGDSIAQTLGNAYERGQEVFVAPYGEFDEAFEVRLIRADGGEEIRLVTAGDKQMPVGTPWLVIAAFMAGVTSDPLGEFAGSEGRSPNLQGALPDSLRPIGGMGLFYIRRNVIDLFDGVIRYQFADYRVSMRKGSSSDTYRVLIQHRPQDSWRISGNLFSFEIPAAQYAGTKSRSEL